MKKKNHRYYAIQELYWVISEYQEYKQFFMRIDQQNLVELVVANDGDTFDEEY